MRFIKHAEERIKESPIKMSWAKKLLSTAYKMTLSKKVDSWKFQKYGIDQCFTSYYKKELEIIYTVNKEKDEVITFTVRDKNTREVWGKDLLSGI